MKLLLQGALSGGLVVLVFLQLDLGQVASLAFQPERAPLLLAALILFNASKILAALRLNVYQRHAAIHLGEGENLRLYYAGMFLNLLLPGGIGGDAYKVLVLHRSHSLPLRTVVAITLADRVSGLLSLLFILCMLAPLLPLPWTVGQAAWFTVASLAAIGAVFVLGHRRLLGLGAPRLVAVAALGVAVQLLQLVCMALLLAYLGAPAGSYVAYLALFLVSSIAAVLPLSVGGLGVREASFLVGVRLFRLDPACGVLAASCFFLLTLLSALAGALFLGRYVPRPAPAR